MMKSPPAAAPVLHPRLGDRLVLVVGGGIGGLAAAVALQKDGANVLVCERDEGFEDRKQGYGLTLTYNEQGALAKLGILEDIKTRDEQQSPSRRHWIFSPDGTVLGYYGNDFVPSDAPPRTQRGNLRIPRQELRQLLLQRLRPGTVLWGKRLSALDGVKVPGAAADGGRATATGRAAEANPPKRKRELAAMTVGEGGVGEGGAVVVVNGVGVEEEATPPRKKRAEGEERVVARFTDGSSVDGIAVLVGADGIRSRTRDILSSLSSSSSLPSPEPSPTSSPPSSSPTSPASTSDANADPDAPHYTGVFIVLGISALRHPLLHEGGFYTLDGTHRLFTMPFKGSQGLTMWQLSFRLPSFADALALLASTETVSPSTSVGRRLMDEVLRRCAGWHAPVSEMVRCSDDRDVWGTPLFDRVPNSDEGATDVTIPGAGTSSSASFFPSSVASSQADPHCAPPSLQQQQQQQTQRRQRQQVMATPSWVSRCVALLGDAAHPMTPFKGQGANQALADAVRLATCLRRAPPAPALKAYAREMVAASSVKVLESRAAAALLHSPRVLPRRLRDSGGAVVPHDGGYKSGHGGHAGGSDGSHHSSNDTGGDGESGGGVSRGRRCDEEEDSVGDNDGGYGPSGILRFAGVADEHMFTLLRRLRDRGVCAAQGSATNIEAEAETAAAAAAAAAVTAEEFGGGERGGLGGGGQHFGGASQPVLMASPQDLVSEVRRELEALERDIGGSAREAKANFRRGRKTRD